MTVTIPVPIREDADGVWRVGQTRVMVESVISAFYNGETAEEIALNYSTLELADIYAVISHYLRHREEVEVYLHRAHIESESVRQENERRFAAEGVRARLMARQAG